MAVEDQVRDLLHTVVPHPPLGLDADTVERSARRRHRRHVALTTLPAVAVVTALVLGGTALLGRSDRPSSVVPTGQAPRWHQVADMPLSPRWLPLVAWTGDEAIVVGGLTGSTVGVGQDATTLADGAAYEPEAGTWRTTAPAPEHLSSVDDTSVLVDDTLSSPTPVASWPTTSPTTPGDGCQTLRTRCPSPRWPPWTASSTP
jgi:hypothetical protein